MEAQDDSLELHAVSRTEARRVTLDHQPQSRDHPCLASVRRWYQQGS